MALNFPDSPSLNDTYASPTGVTYQWDGVKWRVQAPAEFPSDPIFNSLTVDTDTLYVDSVNSRVGIQKTDPQYPLDVVGEIRASSGVLFGADTSAANTLDDYEEGTFTPTFEGGTVYAYQDGHYTKTGNIVHFFIRVQASSATGNSSRWQIFGLPFASTSAYCYGGAFRNYGDHLPRSTFPDLNFHITTSSTAVRAYNAQTTLLSNTSGVDLLRQIVIQGFYRVD